MYISALIRIFLVNLPSFCLFVFVFVVFFTLFGFTMFKVLYFKYVEISNVVSNVVQVHQA